MTWIQIGKPKSGNSWIYNILRSILRKRGQWRDSYIQQQPIYEEAKTWDLSQQDQASHDVIDITDDGCYYRISSAYREHIDDLQSYMEEATLVWTHSLYSEYTPRVLKHCDKKIYMCRDPRDVALSMARFQLTPYMKKYYPNPYESTEDWLKVNYAQNLRGWCKHVGEYLARTEELDLHWVFFERLKRNFDSEVRRLGSYLDVDLADKEIEAIKEETSLESMKEESPDHVQKGEDRQWTARLSDRQIQTAEEIAGPLLDLIGYPRRPHEKSVPQQPEEIDSKEIFSMVRRARPSLVKKMSYKFRGFIYEYAGV
jgi:aryl sulfotransferase